LYKSTAGEILQLFLEVVFQGETFTTIPF